MTKKFIASLTKDGRASSRSRFLIPARSGVSSFEEIETGELRDAGYVIYTGKELSSPDVIARLPRDSERPESLCQIIDSYLDQIALFKVGNVVAIESVVDGQVRLRLVSNTPKS